MSQEGRFIQTDPVVIGVWSRLTRQFATWNGLFFSALSWRARMQFSNDQMLPVLAASHWKKGLGLLGGLSDAQVDFLLTFARLNASRSERIFRLSALLMVSVPIAAALAVSQIAPDLLEEARWISVETIIALVVGWGLATGVLLAASWRARDIADLVEFEQARRHLENAKLEMAP